MHGLGGRSLTESSIDNDTTEAAAVPARWRRRSVIAGLAGTAVGATALTATRFLPDGDGPPDATDIRRSAEAPADAGGFANRDESYASIGQPAQISATQVAPPTVVYPTAAEAAAAAQVVVPTILDPADPVIHLLRRTTFGPSPGLVDEVHAVGIDAWLASQLDPITLADPLADAVWAAHPLANADPATVQASTERYSWDAMFAFGKATLARQVWSARQLYEVMVDFWANHLNVPTPGPGGWDVAPSYHRGVIRTHALGTFTDMLVAAGRHPALLRYLTAEQSTKDSVNENLGRELLELHTVGVASGYTEADVRNSAFILTGRTVVGPGGTGQEAAFRFDPGMHWVGPVTVLDFQHPNATAEGGLEVGDAYLRHLAGHPATAQTIARKLAVRFVSDMPPPELVDRLAAAYLDNGTAIVPEEDPVRSVDALYQAATRSGHRPLSWPAPNGYPDVHAAWRSAGNVVELWNVHRSLVGDWEDGLTRPDPVGLLDGRPAGTVGEYVDSLCSRLCFQAFQPAHRDALVAFLGGDPAAPIGRFVDNNEVLSVIALVLDSPYFS